MKQIYLTIIICLTVTSSMFSQTVEENKRKRYEEEVEKKKKKYISDLVATLDVDDFQKEIITQSMDSYFDKVQEIQKLNIPPFEKKGRIESLDITHFEDLKVMISEKTMTKILDALKGKWDKKKEKRDKKKKKRKN